MNPSKKKDEGGKLTKQQSKKKLAGLEATPGPKGRGKKPAGKQFLEEGASENPKPAGRGKRPQGQQNQDAGRDRTVSQDYSEAPAKSKGRGRGRGKKQPDQDQAETSPKPKGRGRGRGKNTSDQDIAENSPEPKGRGRGRGKNKSYHDITEMSPEPKGRGRGRGKKRPDQDQTETSPEPKGRGRGKRQPLDQDQNETSPAKRGRGGQRGRGGGRGRGAKRTISHDIESSMTMSGDDIALDEDGEVSSKRRGRGGRGSRSRSRGRGRGRGRGDKNMQQDDSRINLSEENLTSPEPAQGANRKQQQRIPNAASKKRDVTASSSGLNLKASPSGRSVGRGNARRGRGQSPQRGQRGRGRTPRGDRGRGRGVKGNQKKQVERPEEDDDMIDVMIGELIADSTDDLISLQKSYESVVASADNTILDQALPNESETMVQAENQFSETQLVSEKVQASATQMNTTTEEYYPEQVTSKENIEPIDDKVDILEGKVAELLKKPKKAKGPTVNEMLIRKRRLKIQKKGDEDDDKKEDEENYKETDTNYEEQDILKKDDHDKDAHVRIVESGKKIVDRDDSDDKDADDDKALKYVKTEKMSRTEEFAAASEKRRKKTKEMTTADNQSSFLQKENELSDSTRKRSADDSDELEKKVNVENGKELESVGYDDQKMSMSKLDSEQDLAREEVGGVPLSERKITSLGEVVTRASVMLPRVSIFNPPDQLQSPQQQQQYQQLQTEQEQHLLDQQKQTIDGSLSTPQKSTSGLKNPALDPNAFLQQLGSRAQELSLLPPEVSYNKMQRVKVKIIMSRIIEIDTIGQQFDAEVYIQARWVESNLQGKSEKELDSIPFSQCWNPKFVILNLVGGMEKDRLSIMVRYEPEEVHPVVTYMWFIKGTFAETMELEHFPFDTQEISIIVSSDRSLDEIDLVQDNQHLSEVSAGAVKDSQEWKSFRHIEFKQDFRSSDFFSTSMHPVLVASGHVRRRLGYYMWNFFIVIFIIIGLSLPILSIDPTGGDRLGVTLTLFLTCIAFKLVVKTTLPHISYLTYLDIYLVFTLMYLGVQAAENAIIAHLARYRKKDKVVFYDEISQSILLGLLALFHAVFLIHIQLTAFKRRRLMDDKEYNFHLDVKERRKSKSAYVNLEADIKEEKNGVINTTPDKKNILLQEFNLETNRATPTSSPAITPKKSPEHSIIELSRILNNASDRRARKPELSFKMSNSYQNINKYHRLNSKQNPDTSEITSPTSNSDVEMVAPPTSVHRISSKTNAEVGRTSVNPEWSSKRIETAMLVDGDAGDSKSGNIINITSSHSSKQNLVNEGVKSPDYTVVNIL